MPYFTQGFMFNIIIVLPLKIKDFWRSNRIFRNYINRFVLLNTGIGKFNALLQIPRKNNRLKLNFFFI